MAPVTGGGPVPVFPRQESMRGLCPNCGDRLIPGQRPRTWVHSLTASLRCPPVQRTCSLCSRDGLVACSEPGCQVIGHPAGGCMGQCSCCGSWGCPAHVSTVDFLCTSCAGHGSQPFEHDGVPA